MFTEERLRIDAGAFVSGYSSVGAAGFCAHRKSIIETAAPNVAPITYQFSGWSTGLNMAWSSTLLMWPSSSIWGYVTKDYHQEIEQADRTDGRQVLSISAQPAKSV
jgi:hypothetical protein